MRRALLAAGLALAAACGGGAPDVEGTRATETTATVPATPTTTVVVDREGISELEVLAPELLLLAAELPGAGLEDLGYAPAPLPGCGFLLDDEEPADLHVGTTLGAGGVAFVSETIRVYPDAGAAADAFEAALAAEEPCRRHQQAFTGPTDVTERVGADRAAAFSALDPGGSTEVVHALVGDAVITFLFPPPGRQGELPALEVAAFGVGKILAALEA